MSGEDCLSATPPNSSHVFRDVSRCRPDIRSVVVNPSDAVIITTPVEMSVAHDEQQQQQQQPQGSPMTGIHGPSPLWDGTRWHQNDVTCGPPATMDMDMTYGYDPRPLVPLFHGTAPRYGCQPEEEEPTMVAPQTMAARLSTVQEESRRELAYLRAVRVNLKAERYRLMIRLAGVIKKKSIIKKNLPLMHSERRLWRETSAIMKRCRKLAKLAIQGELAPMQRELAALEKQEREQTASIDLWLAGLPQEEGSFLGWYHEDIKDLWIRH